ncbi:hypothetical protein CRG98_012011 [Punica granatum]|uniref:Uncharacterized protein n=1 Tax=Punica granatum TaxID=22663 RepID=A0A2I0KGH6_PUNGR|nr:hypothetical protein CRG98_012011 [Punica granatum]
MDPRESRRLTAHHVRFKIREMDTFEEGEDFMPSGELGKLTVPSNGYQPWALVASPWHEDLSRSDHGQFPS